MKGLTNATKSSSSIECTLTSSGWSSTTPATQIVTVSGVTAESVGIFGLSKSASSAQYIAAVDARLFISNQTTDTVTVTAYGVKPTINIPCVVNIMG